MELLIKSLSTGGEIQSRMSSKAHDTTDQAGHLRVKHDRKKALKTNLQNAIFCKLGRSKLLPLQLGVIAVRDIPQGTDPFEICNATAVEAVFFNKTEIESFPNHTRDQIKKFIIPDNSTGEYAIPETGMNGLDMSYYMNSEDGNIMSLSG